MIPEHIKKNILTYADMFEYIKESYKGSGMRKGQFKNSIKDIYDLICERELEHMKKLYVREQNKRNG